MEYLAQVSGHLPEVSILRRQFEKSMDIAHDKVRIQTFSSAMLMWNQLSFRSL